MLDMSTYPILDSFSFLRREISLIFAGELKAAALGHQQALILYRLTESPCTMSELAAHTQSDPAATTRTVAALEKTGLVKRSSDPKDARKTIVQVAAKGRAQAERAFKARNRIGDLINETLSAEERADFCRLLEKVAEGLQSNRPSHFSSKTIASRESKKDS
jgi:DNA-binding MarR family transcriptional regulator